MTCDHSPMGGGVVVTCSGCGIVMGRFEAPDGRVFTTQAAFEGRGPDAPSA